MSVINAAADNLKAEFGDLLMSNQDIGRNSAMATPLTDSAGRQVSVGDFIEFKFLGRMHKGRSGEPAVRKGLVDSIDSRKIVIMTKGHNITYSLISNVYGPQLLQVEKTYPFTSRIEQGQLVFDNGKHFTKPLLLETLKEFIEFIIQERKHNTATRIDVVTSQSHFADLFSVLSNQRNKDETSFPFAIGSYAAQTTLSLPNHSSTVAWLKTFEEYVRDRAQSSSLTGVNTGPKAPGGIDFNAANMQFNRSGNPDIAKNFDPAMIERIKQGAFDGLEFQIERIVPVSDLKKILIHG